jgi:hypothetical protein
MSEFDPRRNGSVTKADVPQGTGGAPLMFTVDPMLFSPALSGAKKGLPAWWSPIRDATLRATIHIEDMWASAIAKATTKQAALGFTVTDTNESDIRIERAQRTLLFYDGAWTQGIQRHLQDYLLCDNGAFIEVERVSRAPWSRVRALWHLDSMACRRTGNEQYPVIYTDARGEMHALRYDQVIAIADQPSPMRRAFGVGLCAASRAWQTILKLAAIEIYFSEKITGGRTLAIHFVNGIGQDQLDDIITSADESQATKGYVVYKGSIIVPLRAMTASPEVVTIDLASIPDGFDAQSERADAYLRYANAIGVPVQDIQPLSGQGLGTGAQSVILAEEAEGYGLAAWRKTMQHYLNTWVLPPTTQFSWTNLNDARERRQKAEADKMRIDALAAAVAVGALTPQQMMNIMADESIIPREMVAQDLTPGGALADSEKPLEEQEAQGLLGQARARVTPGGVLPDGATGFKATARSLIDEEWDAAIKMAEEAQTE